MKILIYILFLFVLFSCTKEGTEPLDQKNSDSFMKEKLIGTWVEVSPCDSCFTLSFESNDTIVQQNTSTNEVVYYSYKIYSKDSIEITRLWETSPNIKTTTHKFDLIHQDTLELIQFFTVAYGLTGFEDIKLHKLD